MEHLPARRLPRVVQSISFYARVAPAVNALSEAPTTPHVPIRVAPASVPVWRA